MLLIQVKTQNMSIISFQFFTFWYFVINKCIGANVFAHCLSKIKIGVHIVHAWFLRCLYLYIQALYNACFEVSANLFRVCDIIAYASFDLSEDSEHEHHLLPFFNLLGGVINAPWFCVVQAQVSPWACPLIYRWLFTSFASGLSEYSEHKLHLLSVF